MGFWKDVWYDMQHGMSEEEAIALNAKLRSGKNKQGDEKTTSDSSV